MAIEQEHIAQTEIQLHNMTGMEIGLVLTKQILMEQQPRTTDMEAEQVPTKQIHTELQPNMIDMATNSELLKLINMV